MKSFLRRRANILAHTTVCVVGFLIFTAVGHL